MNIIHFYSMHVKDKSVDRISL